MTFKEKVIKYLEEFIDDKFCDYATGRDIDVFILPHIKSMQEEPVSEDRTSYDVGFYEGFKKCKQQMMKDAVECDVTGHGEGWLYFGPVPECDYDFKRGDKVKLIIIKEGEL